MLWTSEKVYREDPFDTEADLEEAILQVAPALFGVARVYLDAKRRIGVRGRDAECSRRIPH